jgi:broad specificity phosphatase PhoE
VWVGHWQGQSAAQLADDPNVQRYFADPLHVCDAIEATSAVAARVAAAADRIQRRCAGAYACLVSHGDPIRLLLARALGLPPAGFRRLHVAPGSISIIDADRTPAGVRMINWLPDLRHA